MQQVELMPWHNGLLMELLLTVPPELEWDDAAARVTGCLEANKSTFLGRGAVVTVDLSNRPVDADQLRMLSETLDKNFGLLMLAVVGTDRLTQAAAKQLNITNYMLPPGSKVESSVTSPNAGSNALYIPTTIRSGQRVVHGGHVVVCGDLNSGGEVIAVGDIMVFGTLRGLAHAGCQGDETCKIIAGSMRPQQIRIASQMARSPENNAKDARRPEIARIENGSIQVFPA